jgi:hypothetical protein
VQEHIVRQIVQHGPVRNLLQDTAASFVGLTMFLVLGMLFLILNLDVKVWRRVIAVAYVCSLLCYSFAFLIVLCESLQHRFGAVNAAASKQ